MFCKNCGTQLANDSKFCSQCGNKTEEFVSGENVEGVEAGNAPIECECEKADISSTNRFKSLYTKIAGKLFFGGFLSAMLGTILFIGVILVGLIGWGKIYLYDGYEITAILTTVSLVFMLLGLVVLSCTVIINLKFKSIKLLTKKVFVVLSIVLIIFCVGLSTWGFIDCANKPESGSSYSGSSYGGSYNDNYNSGVAKNIGLSLKVDNIKTSGSYTYVYCTVTNVSSKYVATRYRYVKVKAQFKSYSGSIVDTDWTYAVDSAWLEPGESKSFYYMVKNTNIKSATLSFIE